MKKSCSLLCSLIFFAALSASQAIDLKESKLTQVVNDVQIISAASQTKKTATVNDVFSMPDILRTGDASRAELVASDQTVTRVGANTIFSFDPANRTVDLKQGSLLFHSPHGKGGGTIHTGSATASVLGTTLIVVTTPSGGLKVLDLEGEVEVKFLNGLKQKLEAGQMTFILPGGNQLAPVLIFRLDSLTQNSLLVKGFNQPLASLPLIHDQIDKQIKLIKSGKETDTGLYAGDDANASQVEVLDINSIKHNLNSAKTAFAHDATISQSSLTDFTIPTPPNHVFPANSFQLLDNNYFGDQVFSGFAARNIFFNPDSIPLTVNLSPYSGMSEFDFVADQDADFQGSVNFHGFSSQNSLFIYAGHQINVASGSTIEGDSKDFELLAPGAFLLDDSELKNSIGHLSLNFNSDVTFQNQSSLSAAGNLIVKSRGNLTFDNSSAEGASILLSPLAGLLTINQSTLTTAGHVIFLTAHAVNISSSTINSGDFVISGNQVAPVTINDSTINANSGTLKIAVANNVSFNNSALSSANTLEIDSSEISLKDTSVSAHYLSLNSGDGILLDAGGKVIAGTGVNATANLVAPNMITVKNADLSSMASVNMMANTITINGVSFGANSIDNFGTQTGQVNVNGTLIPGGFNCYNSSYGGVAITTVDQINMSSGPGTTPGMYSYALGGHGNSQ